MKKITKIEKLKPLKPLKPSLITEKGIAEANKACIVLTGKPLKKAEFTIYDTPENVPFKTELLSSYSS